MSLLFSPLNSKQWRTLPYFKIAVLLIFLCPTEGTPNKLRRNSQTSSTSLPKEKANLWPPHRSPKVVYSVPAVLQTIYTYPRTGEVIEIAGTVERWTHFLRCPFGRWRWIKWNGSEMKSHSKIELARAAGVSVAFFLTIICICWKNIVPLWRKCEKILFRQLCVENMPY